MKDANDTEIAIGANAAPGPVGQSLPRFLCDSFCVIGIKPIDRVGQNSTGEVLYFLSSVCSQYAKLALCFIGKANGIT